MVLSPCCQHKGSTEEFPVKTGFQRVAGQALQKLTLSAKRKLNPGSQTGTIAALTTDTDLSEEARPNAKEHHVHCQ